MLLLYFAAAAIIVWGIGRDLRRGETWMIGFGKISRRDNARVYWLTIVLRAFIFLIVILAAYLRSHA